jgi:hypothetical protein
MHAQHETPKKRGENLAMENGSENPHHLVMKIT